MQVGTCNRVCFRIFSSFVSQNIHTSDQQNQTARRDTSMKLSTAAFFIFTIVPAFSEAKAPYHLRRLHDGAFDGDDQGGFGYGGHPDNSEYFDKSHRSNQMMGGAGGPEFAAIECDAAHGTACGAGSAP